METRANPALADLEQLSRHLDLLHEELIDFENSLLQTADGLPSRVIELVKAEVECEKSLLLICSYLNKRIEHCLRSHELEAVVTLEGGAYRLWDADVKERLLPLSLTSQTQSVFHRSSEERKAEPPAEADTRSKRSFFPYRKPRGPYRRYTESDKRKAINTALRLGSQNKAAEILGLPIKNLKRWIKNGPIRRKGGRRTQDPTMETRLIAWIENYKAQHRQFPSSKEVRNRAIQYSANNKQFKASKGWFEKFMQRHYSEEFGGTRAEPMAEEGDEVDRLPDRGAASPARSADMDESEIIFR